ncbi:MAG: sigma-70 family RNA polymerase sigma factor [Planctomycetota bacterium]
MATSPQNPTDFGQLGDEELTKICADVQSDAFEDAFAELYRRYRDRVYAIAYRMTGQSVDAMDVVQECFRVLFQKLGSFRADAKFSTWLYRLVVNCSIDHNRRETARTTRVPASLEQFDHGAEPADQSVDPLQSAADSELGEHVHRALGRLSDKLRSVLVLRYLEGLSYDQLAETLEIQLGTVKSRLARAHVALEQILEGSLPAHDYPLEKTAEDDASGDSRNSDRPDDDPNRSASGAAG